MCSAACLDQELCAVAQEDESGAVVPGASLLSGEGGGGGYQLRCLASPRCSAHVVDAERVTWGPGFEALRLLLTKRVEAGVPSPQVRTV